MPLRKLSNIDNKKCIIVIPVYKQKLTNEEKICLFQCINILGNKFEICLVYPESLDIAYYQRISNGFNFNLLACNDQYFVSTASYSLLCENPDFYNCFFEYTYMLIYQLDGWVFVNELEYFLNQDYDYNGSPWPAGSYGFGYEKVGNGGVSLRKIQTFIKLCESINKYDLKSKYAKTEDIFFCKYIKAIKKDILFKIAPATEGMKFGWTTCPGTFFHKNNDKLPMFAHGWNLGYDYDDFWHKYIPYNEFKDLKELNYNIYINKINENKINQTEKQNNMLYNYYSLAPKKAEQYDYYDNYYSFNNLKADKNKNNKKELIIVTFTTWQERINNIPHIIDCILANTMQPNKICINLSIQDFPNKELDFPEQLQEYIKKYNIIEINWLSNNTKTWKKLIPTLCKYKDDIVISIDDDWEYPKDMIKTLYDDFCKYNKKYPISGNHERYFGMNCHCGCCSLTKYNLLNAKGQFDYLSDECMKAGSDDIFYSYCAYINGNEYKRSSKMYFTNMTPYQANNSYSAANNVNINNTYNIIKECWEIQKKGNKLTYINQQVTPTNIKVALCAIAKNENLYIREWVEYYKSIGINQIFLYDNNEKDGEQFEEVINDYISDGYVTVIDKRGIEKGLVYNENHVNLQPQCYCECYEKYGNNFDWMCFFDIDEFLTFKNVQYIQQFIDNKQFDKFDTILIPWETYDDNDMLYYEDRPVMERFTRISEIYKRHLVKSIVRTKQKLYRDMSINCLIHSFLTENESICDTLGKAIKKLTSNFYIYTDKQCKNSPTVLNHYKTKSFEEFFNRHFGRHWGTGKHVSLHALTIEDCIERYFMINKKNKAIQEEINFFLKNTNTVDVYMASIWRDGHVINTVKSIINQYPVRTVTISANNFTDIQIQQLKDNINSNKLIIKETDNKKGSNEKLKFINEGVAKYVAFCDDDLIYFNGYFEKMIKKCEELKGAVSYHGSKFIKFPIKSYYQDRNVYCYNKDIKNNIQVDVIGNGVSLFKREFLTEHDYTELYNNAPEISMDDILISYILKLKGYKLYVISHNINEVINKEIKKNEQSVYLTYNNNCKIQTIYINEKFKNLL
ncbi:MAG: hypothetical protein [Wendovervirus sonii]|uniref:DUF5672 domain-containing protein n=1 Tax=phage Lak_Megaphage_Sonny TaxID=3109229 RepID=A0ABZ0Z2A1_9CAUD|nr:MAG: hypothetical protein [phage Lak_Megaphage_Sonny]